MVDATCPLVTKVHVEAIKFAKQGYSLVLVGHRDHEEVEGTQGEAPEVTQVVSTVEEVEALVVPDPDKLAYLTQTTLSLDEAGIMIDALKKKFPNIIGPHAQDICYATENRQVAVKNVAHGADLVLVVGSKNSSNSNRLVEVSKNLETNSYLIDTADAIQAGVAGGRQYRCRDRRRIGSGGAGEGRCRISAIEGLWRCRRSRGYAGECSLRPAAGDRPGHCVRSTAVNRVNETRRQRVCISWVQHQAIRSESSRRSHAMAGWTSVWSMSPRASSAPRTGCSASSTMTATGAASSKPT